MEMGRDDDGERKRSIPRDLSGIWDPEAKEE